jgi:choline-sulfatase
VADRPNILFLLSDEHSFRCLGQQDDPQAEPVDTPTFDSLAKQGTNFARTYCQMPLCTPSRLCLLTGREVRNCNGWTNNNVLPPNRTTLADAFGQAGYDTCLVGKMHLGGDRQFVGFDDRPYGDLTGGTGHQWEPLACAGERSTGDRLENAGVTEIPESKLQEYVTTRESLSWIRDQEARSDSPWFLCASFSRPHFPLTAPRRYLNRYWDLEQDEPKASLTKPPIERGGDSADHPMTEGAVDGFETAEIDETTEQRARAAYFASVEFLDDVIGEFLETLARDGFFDNTIVVYASDHGELAGEHGLWWKHTWHEAATRVPFFVQTPAHREKECDPATIETPVSLADLFPTFGGLAGVPVPDDLDGVDLSETIETGAEPERGPVICDNLVPRWGEGTEFRMIRDGDYKYIRFRDAPELFFNLAADPKEFDNLVHDATGETRDVLEQLRNTVDETMNFDAAVHERERDRALQSKHQLNTETRSHSGNCYLMNDQTVIDADEPLYYPYVVIENADETLDYGSRE